MSRAIRVGDFIRDEISKIILHEVRDPRLTKHLAVNDVVVSKDLSYADIYVSSFEHDNDSDQQTVSEVLNGASGFFRTLLSKRLSIRTTPKLRFHYDTLHSEGISLEQKIREARSKDQVNISNDEE